LNADKGNTSEIVVASVAGQERRDVDACIGLVEDLDININVRPEHPPFGTIGCNAVHSRQRIRGRHGAPPPDHISVVIVVRRLDEDELKASPYRYIELQPNCLLVGAFLPGAASPAGTDCAEAWGAAVRSNPTAMLMPQTNVVRDRPLSNVRLQQLRKSAVASGGIKDSFDIRNIPLQS
jgi:hypothetical protein